jgi:hypothetical protein
MSLPYWESFHTNESYDIHSYSDLPIHAEFSRFCPWLVADVYHKASAGLQSHFNLPRTKLTPELKRDLQLLNMRAVLDPKRMYKKQGKFKIPEYSQLGTIVEGPTDFFSARLNNRDRKRTLVEETLASEASSGRFKRKYDEVQAKKRSGKKSFYKDLMAKRKTRGA